MPVARRVAKTRTSASEVDDLTWDILTDAVAPEDLPNTWDGRLMVVFADVAPEPNLRTAWNAHSDQIVAAFAQATPGTRPTSWWRWDAPEPRRVLAEPETLLDADDEPETVFLESEAAYLQRHDLLLDGEAALLGEDDFAPVELTQTREAWTCAGQHGEPRRSAALRRVRPS
jgi:hypothetical protein